MYYNSQYNFCFKTEGGILLYNSSSASTFKLSGDDSEILGNYLVGKKSIIDIELFDDAFFKTLLSKGFIVEDNRSELLEIRERFWKAKGETPLVLTITTTMNCNLGCYYCYEERSGKKLEFIDTDSIINHLESLYKNSPKKSLHVDWYGGEPLLNIEYMEKASNDIQNFCSINQINYHASIISNGTLWPNDVESFVRKHKIRQVQISFDGLKANHNIRRRYRKEFANGEDNSFDITFELVDKLLEFVMVDIRFNIDWKNQYDVDSFIDTIVEKGWFNKRYPAVFQPARLSAYSEKSSFMNKKQLSLDEFDEIREKISTRLKGIGKVEESEVPDGFPYPKTSVCAALATDSFVVGADKLIYRCGLQVGETHRAVASLDSDSKLAFNDSKWWEMFDPTKADSCSKCSFLPVCFGGCPKKHLEKDKASLDEQSTYWRNNLAPKIAQYLKLNLLDNQPISEKLQFRDGY